jgi:2-dehydropantoate 2-reductase
MMRVLILGAGALGSLVGARLSHTDAETVLLSTNAEHMRTIRNEGLLVEELDGTISRHALQCCDAPSQVAAVPDLVIVLVKSHATEAAVKSVEGFRRDSTVFLTLQNGMGNWERIAGVVGEGSVLAGTTAQGATLVAPGRIRHGGAGATHIGEVHGAASKRVARVVDLFRRAGLDAHSSDHVEQLLWEKLIVNVGINAITALTGGRNGVVADFEAARDVSMEAVAEALAVAEAKGATVSSGMAERVLAIARATSVNRSSMGQDVDRCRKTEIDAINGAVVRFAEEAGVDVPVNRTLTRLVRTLESVYSA